MPKVDLNNVPKFAQLPIKPDKPKESSWGVFGDDDELGCLNFLTPQGVVDAAHLVRKGSVFRLIRKSITPSRRCSRGVPPSTTS